MTIQQTVKLVEVFLTEPTVTSTKILKNETISFPDIVVCLNQPFYLELPFETDLKVIQNLLANVSKQDYQMLINGTGIPELNSELVKLIFEIFRSITLAEIQFSFQQGPTKPYWSPYSFTNIQSRRAAVDLVFSHLKAKNISLETLSKVAAVHLCKLLRLNVTLLATLPLSNKFINMNVCTSQSIASFTVLGICVRLNENVQFNSPLDTLFITVEPQAIFIDSRNLIKIYLDLSGRSMYASFLNKGNVLSVDYNHTKVVSAHVLGHYKTQDLRRAHCSNDLRKYDCEISCYGYTVVDVCNCWSIAAASMKPKTIPLCLENFIAYENDTEPFLIPQYRNCLHDLKFPLQLCRKECLPECEYQQVLFMTESSFENSLDKNSTSLNISVTDFVYPLLVESLSKDWQTLLNEFGGNIGLWLGGSLVASVHLPIFFAKRLLQTLLSKRSMATVNIQTQS